ncbi:hypothetical protein CEXT_312681 [Caerostris extrusa]|uniref:Uncharacterized protein n=1 Tax=Caerostris extrusa TaxID=172846 RepID=A0AAV4UIQ1_CAEEX|nr:hypothetical protein CEXT_312681 [Caerostris extrusa]
MVGDGSNISFTVYIIRFRMPFLFGFLSFILPRFACSPVGGVAVVDQSDIARFPLIALLGQHDMDGKTCIQRLFVQLDKSIFPDDASRFTFYRNA